ncbi:hypothetical protein [Thalassospira sp. MCCC 1A01428]|uniref:hypothetical protein n=1 Tax=Thalassospira sp. MCCC 1A01428 TaxID=1470575 RepID=UPI000A1E691C|nr:hypothetical protein [Thalassospira sp. MCCC 1A01428]OSQ33792.1 hypothetical protein THS27_25950 [Thalassospira sp. MCCC 1A01428]
MSVALKYGAPLASDMRLAGVGVAANDVARLPVPGALRRGLREVSRDVVPRRKFDLFWAVERAFFPRYFWAVAVGMLDDSEADSRDVIDILLADQQEWADLMLPSQFHDFRNEFAKLVDVAMAVMMDRQIGGGGGWKTSRLMMVGYGLCQLADAHAVDAMFTTRFAKVLNRLAEQHYFINADEMRACEGAAHKSLRKVIAALKSRGRFLWLPDYSEARHFDGASYAHADHIANRFEWQVMDCDTGKPVAFVREVNTAEGWLVRLVVGRDGRFVHGPDGAIATEKLVGNFRIERGL